MKKRTNRILSILLTLALSLGLVALAPVTASAAGVVDVRVNGGKLLNAANPYLVGGAPAASGTLGSGGCTAQFVPSTGTLTLQNYSGGEISARSSGDLTINLVGTNTITSSGSYGISHYIGGSVTITSTANASLAIYVN